MNKLAFKPNFTQKSKLVNTSPDMKFANYLKQQKIYAIEKQIVYQWKDNYWQEVEEMKLLGLALDWLNQSSPEQATARKAHELVNTAKVELSNKMPLSAWKEKDILAVIPLKNAYVVVKRDKVLIEKPEKEYGLTYQINSEISGLPESEYKPLDIPKDCRFKRFLDMVLPQQEIQNIIQEFCGMTLLPANYRIATWWTGRGANAKSTLANLVGRFHNKTANVRLEKLNDQFGLEHVIGASLIRVDEVPERHWDEGVFKSLVSVDGVNINRK